MLIIQAITVLLLLLLAVAQWPGADGFTRRWLPPETLRKDAVWLSPEPSRVFRGEAVAVIAAAALVLLAFSYRAFSGFFIAEDFTYLGLYEGAGNRFWSGILTPISHTFFRPSAAAWCLAFQRLLPVDPWAHHLRNYLTTVVATALLYVLLRRLVASPLARIAGVAFFAVSKIHLTTIGYINCNDSILGLIQIEATLCLLIVYFQTDRPLFFWLACLPYALEVFSRDSGVVVFAIVAAALFVESRRHPAPWRFWTLRAAPFAAIAAAYVAIRYLVLQAAAAGHGLYQLRLDPEAILRRVWIFSGNLFNVSLAAVDVSGAGSFVNILHIVVPRLPVPFRPLDAAFTVAALLLTLAIVIAALRADRRGWVPLVWAAAFIGPTFLVLNIQMYYVLEPLAGVALLLAISLGALNRRLATGAVFALIAAVAVNNVVESRSPEVYSWRFCANAAQRVYEQAIRPHAGQPLRSWTLFVPDERQIGFWAYTLTADSTCPMIPALLDRPGLRVAITAPRPVAPEELRDAGAPIYFAAGNRALRVGPLSIRAAAPGAATPDGSATLQVRGENLLPTTTVLWNGEPLATVFDETSGALSALVPPRLAKGPGAQLRLRDPRTGLESAPYELGAAVPAAR